MLLMILGYTGTDITFKTSSSYSNRRHQNILTKLVQTYRFQTHFPSFSVSQMLTPPASYEGRLYALLRGTTKTRTVCGLTRTGLGNTDLK